VRVSWSSEWRLGRELAMGVPWVVVVVVVVVAATVFTRTTCAQSSEWRNGGVVESSWG
jgi:predicted ABC-type sugar transport system permease subunit